MPPVTAVAAAVWTVAPTGSLCLTVVHFQFVCSPSFLALPKQFDLQRFKTKFSTKLFRAWSSMHQAAWKLWLRSFLQSMHSVCYASRCHFDVSFHYANTVQNISFELFHNYGRLLIQLHLNYADSTVVDWHKAQITFINMVDDGIAKYEHIKTILRLSKNILGGGTSSIKLSQQKRMAITLSVKPLFNLDIQCEPLRHYIKV